MTRLWMTGTAVVASVACYAPAAETSRHAATTPRRGSHVRVVEDATRPAPPRRITPSRASRTRPPARPTRPSPQPRRGTHHHTVWDRLAHCESTSRWDANTGNGHYGGLQFTLQSWRGVGGHGYPHHATRVEQIRRAERLLALQGWRAWPGCARKLGLLP